MSYLTTTTPITPQLQRFEGWTPEDLATLDRYAEHHPDERVQVYALETKVEYKDALAAEARELMKRARTAHRR